MKNPSDGNSIPEELEEATVVVKENVQMLLSRLWSALEVLYDKNRATIVSMADESGENNTLVIILRDVRYSKAIGIRDLKPEGKDTNEKT